jgi:hypothetical protein
MYSKTTEFKTIIKVVRHSTIEVRMQLVGSDKFKCTWEHYVIDQNGDYSRLDPWFSFKISENIMQFRTQFNKNSSWNNDAKQNLLEDIKKFLEEYGKLNLFFPRVSRFITDSDLIFRNGSIHRQLIVG